MKRKTILWVMVPLAVVAVLGLFTVVGLVSRSDLGSHWSLGNAVERDLGTADPSDLAAEAAAPVQGEDAGTAGKSTSGGSSGDQEFAAAVPPATALSAHHLVRTGDLSLLVDRGTLLSTVDRIRSLTATMGGYVMSSAVGSEDRTVTAPYETEPLDAPVSDADGDVTSSADPVMDPYAALTVRVPERLFDNAVKRFAELGDVESVSTSSEDVTSQYVDLKARLRHFRAVEKRLVGFLAETDNVNQMLTVQDRIDEVQLTIEQLSAQLKSLRETTTYGTLSIFVREKGVPQAGAIDPSDTFAGTFWNSVELLGHGARVTGLVLTALLPFIVVFGGIGLLVWYVVRRLRRGRRQTAPPSLPA